MRLVFLLLLLGLICGCRSTGDREAIPTSRTKERDRNIDRESSERELLSKEKDRHWLDGNKPEWAKGGDVPKANSWADPRDKKFDYTNYVKGALAGYVFDQYDKPAANTIIAVENAEAGKKMQPMVVLTDDSGAFAVHGLKPNETYILTAKRKESNQMIVGQTYATAPSVNVRIRLNDQMNLPSGPGFGNVDNRTPIASRGMGGMGTIQPEAPNTKLPTYNISPNGDLPPMPGQVIPNRNGDVYAPMDGNWSRTTSSPSTMPAAPTMSPATDELHMPSRVGPSNEIPANPLTAEIKPPALPRPNTPMLPIPTLPSGQTIPILPNTNTPFGSITGTSAIEGNEGVGGLDKKNNTSQPMPGIVTRQFTYPLVDTLGRASDFPSGYNGELILLDFMTTTCVPCKVSIPKLVEFQRQYGVYGLQIAGVLCDNKPESERLQLARKYKEENNLNYQIYTEAKLNEVQNRLQIESYPTLVLIDPSGQVVWRGQPTQIDALTKVMQSLISKK